MSRAICSAAQRAETACSLGEGAIGAAALLQEAAIVNDTSELLNQGAVRAELAVPIRFNSALLGVFYARSTGADSISLSTVAVARLIADQAVLALDAAQLYNMLSLRYEQLHDYSETLHLRNEISCRLARRRLARQPAKRWLIFVIC